jgi:threonine dehydrogenase-like Zn-dependent dehydrogenase
MRALVFDKELKYQTDYPIPEPKEDEALIRVTYAGICNTDLEIIKGYMGFKGILGHEFVGVVEKCSEKGINKGIT